jgi:transposase-like protein
MKVKEQLQFFSDHGVSVSYIARRMGVEPSTLNKWLRGEKGITHKNEDLLFLTLKKMLEEFSSILE